MEKLIEQLKVILGTNFALYYKAHSYHWNVEGPDFPQYHKFLKKLYSAIFENVDNIAEQIRALDSYAPASLSRILELSDISETDIIPSPLIMMANLKNENDRFMIHVRAGIVAANEADEPGISNFLQDILNQHQKHSWMLRSIIK
ncbi:MAG: DNA starvation/stationary phase protection protein [Caulobacteraceae bacterium]|nr:DNA starvation/stationary phase protection protein [Caulobacteraceae bacterium]